MNKQRIFPFLGLALITACGGGGGGDSRSSTPVATSPPPAPVPTTTISYDLSDFERVVIDGSFVASIRRSDEYRIDITIDEDEAGKLNIGSESSALNVGFRPGSDVRANTLEAVIEMPVLTGLSLNGSNNVVVADFDAGVIEIDVFGQNVLSCRSAIFDYIMLNVFGSSMIELVDLNAIPSAHVDVSGSSSVTMNFLDFATVTGSLSGTSTLFYYGSDLNLEMNVAPSANVTRLGDTQ